MAITSMAEVASRHKGHWFDANAKRFFGSRVSAWGYERDDKVYFVSSEKFDHNSPRLYSVRVYDRLADDIDTVGEFQQYKSYSGADKAAQRLAS